MRLAPLALCLVAAPALSQGTAGIGGIALERCDAMVGAANAPLLAQAGDWALGYMAGRIDAGQTPLEGETLSPDDALDIVVAIASRCRDAPDTLVIEAIRAYAERIFGPAEPVSPPQAAPTTKRRPLPRPESLAIGR